MQAKKHSIKQWVSDDKPKEKLLSKNPISLTDSELPAILIPMGPDIKAVDLAKLLLFLE